MRIVLDAMGGDHAPAVPVAGAVAAARAYPDAEILLAGREEVIQAELSRHDTAGLPLQIVPASQVIEMHDHAAMAVRRKKDASIVVGVRLVREGQADAFVSAGHSGATMAAATLLLGRPPGVDRPALATVFPSLQGRFLFADVGATTDCRPEWLLQFARMGAVYAERVFGLSNPRVGLLSNGEEESKGDRLVQESHALLRQAAGLNFVGNVEPKDALLHNAVEVLIADGFVGNIMLKGTEAAAEMLLRMLREELTRTWSSKLAAALLRPAFRRVMARLDYREYGGALLLGLNGVAIIAHGRSDAQAIQNAIRVAREAVLKGAVEAVAEALKET